MNPAPQERHKLLVLHLMKKRVYVLAFALAMLLLGTSDPVGQILLPRYYFYRVWIAKQEPDFFSFQEELLNLARSGSERALDWILRVSDRPGLDGSFAEINTAFACSCLCLVGDQRFSSALDRAESETKNHVRKVLSVSDLTVTAPMTLKTLHLDEEEMAHKAKYGLPLKNYRNVRNIVSR